MILQVDELLMNTQLARGAYNAEKFYAHVVLRPKEAMLLTVPVSELGTVKTVREIIEQVEKEVVDGLDAQIKLREGKKTGVTAVSEIPVPARATADIASSPGAEEPDEF